MSTAPTPCSPARSVRATVLSLVLALALGRGGATGPGVAQAQSAPAPVRTLIGDLAVILRPADATALVRLGLAGPSRSLTLSVRGADARRWADSTARLLAPPPRPQPRRKAAGPAQHARAVLEEPGDGTGSLVLSRTDSAGRRSYLLFADDAALDPIRQPLTRDEVALLVRLVRRVVPAAGARDARPRSGMGTRGGEPPGWP